MQATRSNPAFKSGPRASTAPPASLLSAIGLVFWMCAAVVALVVVAVIMILRTCRAPAGAPRRPARRRRGAGAYPSRAGGCVGDGRCGLAGGSRAGTLRHL